MYVYMYIYIYIYIYTYIELEGFGALGSLISSLKCNSMYKYNRKYIKRPPVAQAGASTGAQGGASTGAQGRAR